MVKKKPRLAIVTTHPIQYNAPLFELLASRARIDIQVFYTWGQASGEVFDPGFGSHRQWDIPLLKNYPYRFVANRSKKPGSHHFWGINNPSLIKEIEQWLPDAILVFGWSFYSHLRCLLHFKKRLPVYFRGDSTLLDETGSIRTLLRRHFLRWVYSNVEKAFYVGTQNKAYFLKHGLAEEQLVPAFHAVDNDRFANADLEQVTALRKTLNFVPADFVVLFAGKLEAKKNPRFICQLAKKLTDQNIKFLVVGNGNLEDELKAVARQDPRICFLPFQNQSLMPTIYRLADCFLLPSRGPGETWGLAANEAMASGLPVILSEKVGGAVDLVRGNGIIFGLQEAEKVANYIKRIQTDAVQREQAKNASVIRIQDFRFEAIASALESELVKTVKPVFHSQKTQQQ